MPNEIDINEIKESLKKARELEEALGGDDFETNIDLDSDDDDDSQNDLADASQIKSLDFIQNKEDLSKALSSMNEEIAEKSTVNGLFRKLSIICSQENHYAAKSFADIEKVMAHVHSTHVDLCLNSSADFPMLDVFDRLISNVVNARNVAEHSGKGPELNLCLAWLAFACQGQVGDIIPPGEQFPYAVQYISKRLRFNFLPKIEEEIRPSLAVFQISRVFEFLSVCDLCNQNAEDRSILLFAVSRIILDKHANAHIQWKAVDVIANIINASSLNRRNVIVEFSRLFCLISDDFCALRLVLECFRLAPIPPYAILALVSSAFISASERAECEPEYQNSMSDDDYIDSHINVIADTFTDAMEVFANAKKNQSSLLNMMDACLVSDLFVSNPDKGIVRFEAIGKITKAYNAKLVEKKGAPDESILESNLNTLCQRMKVIGRLLSDL